MSTDRFVYWKREKPSDRQLGRFLRAYFGSAAKVHWIPLQKRWDCWLRGNFSHPDPRQQEALGTNEGKPVRRALEAWIHRPTAEHPFGSLNVSTRMTDPYTHGAANALARAIALHFGGYWPDAETHVTVEAVRRSEASLTEAHVVFLHHHANELDKTGKSKIAEELRRVAGMLGKVKVPR